jgi:beta-ketodecanoyl-[acyl-carrier-protein] synthase
MKKVVISGSGLFTPPHAVSNEELVVAFNQYVAGWNAARCRHRSRNRGGAGRIQCRIHREASGIKQRFLMDKDGVLDPVRMTPYLPERSNDVLSIQAEMGVAAATAALAQAGKTAADIDMVLVACSNMQRPYPAVSIEIQQALGVQGYAFDMNVACSSATFGIQTAVNAIQSGQARAVLVISPEICSAHLNFRDRDSHFIFGDACTALVLEAAESATSSEQFEILGTRLATVFSNNIRNNFGFSIAVTSRALVRSTNCLCSRAARCSRKCVRWWASTSCSIWKAGYPAATSQPLLAASGQSGDEPADCPPCAGA